MCAGCCGRPVPEQRQPAGWHRSNGAMSVSSSPKHPKRSGHTTVRLRVSLSLPFFKGSSTGPHGSALARLTGNCTKTGGSVQSGLQASPTTPAQPHLGRALPSVHPTFVSRLSTSSRPAPDSGF